MSVPNVRKRLNTLSTSRTSMHSTNFLSVQQQQQQPLFKQLETVADPKSKSGFKTKIYPTTTTTKTSTTSNNIEKRTSYSRQDSRSSTTKSSSRENSDVENECVKRCEEKSQLICYKDNVKFISIKNNSRLTKYSTFDIDVADKRGKIVKYKSLDEPDSKTLIKYLEPHSNVSISAQDFASDLKFSRRHTHKPDMITETVDAWARKTNNNKGVFSNLKNSIFKNNVGENKEIVFKPLVFGGTFPIDRPETKLNDAGNEKANSRLLMNQLPKMREYGTPKTFNIDQPI